ncbi:MAG: phage terminase large subunit family protein [Thiohalomonadaceae bacterium]
MALADQQLEREKLRLAAAKEDFDRALAETVEAKALHAAGAQARAVMLDGIRAMEHRLLTAIDGETDETRVHYLLSDAANDILREIGHTVEQATHALPGLGKGIARGAKPRDLLTVSQWAERRRILATGTNAPGPWRNEKNPHLVEIMDSLSEHSPVRSVWLKKGSGVGGTEVMWNWIGYIVDHLQNKDLLLVVPTIELRDRSYNPRLRKLFDETPALKEKVSTKKRDRKNTSDVIEFGANSRLIKSGANSPDSLRSEHLPYVICDELDAFPWDVGGEGDPVALINNRQRSFAGRAKSYFVSTPTDELASHINVGYEKSDQRKRYVPCPHCGHYHVLEQKNLHWKTDREESDSEDTQQTVIAAWFACPECGGMIEEGHKTDMFAAGRWIAQRPKIKKHRGYDLPAFYSPIGLGETWRDIAQAWLDAQGDTAKLKAYYNTVMGEVYKEPGDSIEDLPLINRLEGYLDRLADLPIALVTAGADVQKDRLEVTLDAWGPEEECWRLAHIILPGDTEEPEVWDDLSDTLQAWQVDHAAIDAGYRPDMVREFVKTRAWCTAIKGTDGMGRPLIEDERKRKQRLRYRRRRGIPLEPIGVDQGKSLIYSRLRMDSPGPRYIHFPDSPDFDEEYFLQLAAEKLVPRKRGNRLRHEWVKIRPRNEALDCAVYSMAAMRLAGADLTQRKRWRTIDATKGQDYHDVPEAIASLGTTQQPYQPVSPQPAQQQQEPTRDPFAPISFARD